MAERRATLFRRWRKSAICALCVPSCHALPFTRGLRPLRDREVAASHASPTGAAAAIEMKARRHTELRAARVALYYARRAFYYTDAIMVDAVDAAEALCAMLMMGRRLRREAFFIFSFAFFFLLAMMPLFAMPIRRAAILLFTLLAIFRLHLAFDMRYFSPAPSADDVCRLPAL